MDSLELISDELFEKTLEKIVPSSARTKFFYVKIAGASHENADGSSRAKIIGDCRILELLEFRREPENPFDSNAVAVWSVDQVKQLGFLESRLAGEVSRDMEKHNGAWMAWIRHHDFHPTTHKVVGAVICVLRFSDEYVAEQAKKLAVANS